MAPLLAVAVMLGASAQPALAQDAAEEPQATSTVPEDGSSGETTQPSDATGEPSTSSTQPATPEPAPETTVPADTAGQGPGDSGTSSTAEPTPAEEAETTTTTGLDETTSSIEGDTTIDPLIDEAPADDALDPNVTVPAPSGADANVDFAPVPILMSNVRQAETKWAEAKAANIEVIAEVRSLRLRSKELSEQQSELEGRTRQTIDELVAATERLQQRAVRGFVRTASGNADGGPLGTVDGADIFRTHDILVHQRKTKLVSAAVAVDKAGIAELSELRSTLGTSARELVDRMGIVASSLRTAEEQSLEFEADVEQARIELEAFKAGSEIYVDGVVFPIGGEYSVPLINSFGYPRMPGTPDAHSHEGIDIFAPRGTPLVAAERGVIGRIGNGRLGGLKFWLRGESGADWYYAHLNAFAPGLHNGQVVEAGELLGYVGNTGNAIGTPPHLHLEIHPNGGAAVNPYPLLKVVSDLDLKSYVDGTHPGFRYQPVVGPQPQQVTTTTTEPETTSTSATSSTTEPGSAPTSNSTSASSAPAATADESGSPAPTAADGGTPTTAAPEPTQSGATSTVAPKPSPGPDAGDDAEQATPTTPTASGP